MRLSEKKNKKDRKREAEADENHHGVKSPIKRGPCPRKELRLYLLRGCHSGGFQPPATATAAHTAEPVGGGKGLAGTPATARPLATQLARPCHSRSAVPTSSLSSPSFNPARTPSPLHGDPPTAGGDTPEAPGEGWRRVEVGGRVLRNHSPPRH